MAVAAAAGAEMSGTLIVNARPTAMPSTTWRAFAKTAVGRADKRLRDKGKTLRQKICEYARMFNDR